MRLIEAYGDRIEENMSKYVMDAVFKTLNVRPEGRFIRSALLRKDGLNKLFA